MKAIGNIYLTWRTGKGSGRFPVGAIKRSATGGIRFQYNNSQVSKAKESGFTIQRLNGFSADGPQSKLVSPGGYGYTCCDIDSIDAELCFRILKGITMVYSADLSFYQKILHPHEYDHSF